MTPTPVHLPPAHEPTSAADRVADLSRQVAHIGHEARLLKNRAADAVDDGVYAARRAVKAATRGMRNVADLRDEAAYRVKCQPLKAVGLAFGVGVLVGAIAIWARREPRVARPFVA